MINYDQRSALIELERLQKEQSDKFCPIRNGDCNSRCVCLFKGDIRYIQKQYIVDPPKCTNKMIIG